MTPSLHPTRQSSASPRERILETARVLFYSRGVNNVGIDRIILESGVAKATLYKHFKSKDELILAYLQTGGSSWLEGFQNRVEHYSLGSKTPLIAVWDALEEWFSQPLFRGCLLTNVVTDLAPPPEHPARAALIKHKERVRAYFETLAEQAGVHPPRAISEQWMVLMEGATVLAARERTAQAAAQARAIAQVLLGGQGRERIQVEPEKTNSMLEHLDFEF
jgi:AcrR family transcriptional regulator